MHLVRIGEKVLNLDLMTDCYHELRNHNGRETLRIYWACPSGPESTQPQTINDLKDEEAEVLWRYLGCQARNLTPATRDDREYEEFRDRGGELSRSQWDTLRAELRSLCAVANPSEANLNRASAIEVELCL